MEIEPENNEMRNITDQVVTPAFDTNTIDDFVSQIRLDNQPRRTANEPQPGTSRDYNAIPGTSSAGNRPQQRAGNLNTQNRNEQMGQARSAADQAILQAERFKAQIQPQSGMYNRNINQNTCGFDREVLRHMRYLDCDDDEFFHTTCHIDESLRKRIERGEFVELEKLIQKKLQLEPNNDRRLQLINKDGESFFVPAVDKDTKIDNVKKWEQAFRVYTTIYCGANPTQSAEILQYVDIIHRAAQTFNWENVARYDYVFPSVDGSQAL